MKNRLFIRRVLAFATGAVLLMTVAQSTSADEENIRNYVEMMRADLNSAKVDVITRVLKLTDAEGKIFWPIYKEYELELSKLGDKRIALIKIFVTAQNSNKIDDKLADDLSKKWFDLQQKRLDLWKKYHGKIAKAVSPVRAAQFIQVEHQVSLLVDIEIASEMPAVGEK